jgi:protein with PEP-CTERM/exosortase system signal
MPNDSAQFVPIYTLSATGNILLNFNYVGIDSVEFRVINGGTHHTGYDFFDDTQFAFDNLDVTTATPFGAVPDRGSTVMLLTLGVCALGFLRKKLA